VRDEVVATTNGVQQPYVYGSLPQRAIYLGPPPPVDSPKAEAAPIQPSPLFTSGDRLDLEKLASQQHFQMPMFDMGSVDPNVPGNYRRFAGIWASKVAMSNGKGRQVMLIVNDVNQEGLGAGFFVWGPPTANTWNQGNANSVAFSSYIRDDVLPFRVLNGGSITATRLAWTKLGKDGAMFIQVQNGEGKTA